MSADTAPRSAVTGPPPDDIASRLDRDRPQPPMPVKRRRRSPLFWLLVIAATAGAGWWTIHFFHRFLNYEETDDAFIIGHVHLVGPRVAGSVQEVLVTDNQAVKAGQPLARLDPLEFEIALQSARAALADARAKEKESQAALTQAQAQSGQMQAQVSMAEAQVGQNNAQLEIAGTNFGRSSKLFGEDARSVAKSEVDTTRSALAASRAGADGAKASLDAAHASSRAMDAAVEAARSRVESAQAGIASGEAAVRDAERQLSYATIAAPADGRIGNKSVEAGNRVQSGQALFAMVEPETWIIANFKETQLPSMRVGQAVDIALDALPGQKLTGKVDSFSPASGAQFALLPPDNATGNFTKVVQRVAVKIVLDPASVRQAGDRLRPGLSATVSVRVR